MQDSESPTIAHPNRRCEGRQWRRCGPFVPMNAPIGIQDSRIRFGIRFGIDSGFDSRFDSRFDPGLG
jgi:hypothetical protein